MLAADVIIAAEDATFAIAYARLGTSPDAGASYFLARTLGYRKALELYLMSERLDGKAAKALGPRQLHRARASRWRRRPRR